MAVPTQPVMFIWHAAVAISVRVLLVLLGVGEALIWQPEVTTPANTALKTREGLALLQLGVSPYSGDSCHVPPLWLAVTAPVALHPALCVLPNIIADVAAAAALYAAASALHQKPCGQESTSRGKDTCASLGQQKHRHSSCKCFGPDCLLHSASGWSSCCNCMLLITLGCLRKATAAICLTHAAGLLFVCRCPLAQCLPAGPVLSVQPLQRAQLCGWHTHIS